VQNDSVSVEVLPDVEAVGSRCPANDHLISGLTFSKSLDQRKGRIAYGGKACSKRGANFSEQPV
jgi:hypothetical protein